MKVKELLKYYDKDLYKDLVVEIWRDGKWIKSSRQNSYRKFDERYKDKEIEKYHFKKTENTQLILAIELKREEE